jgi:SAM-dependent methyltransferase
MTTEEATRIVLAFAARVRRGILIRIHRRLLDRDFDRRRCIETDGIHQPETLDLRGEHAAMAVEYEATPAQLCRYVLAGLAVDFRRFVFIDLGCGKGRVLLLAAEQPFCRIEGVELSTRMHCIAEENVASLGSRASDIVTHNVDAAAYVFPAEPFVLFLFNPFGGTVVARVRDNLERSLRQSPRQGYVIYVNAKHRQVFDDAGFLEELPRSSFSKALDKFVSPWPLAFYRTLGTWRDERAAAR